MRISLLIFLLPLLIGCVTTQPVVKQGNQEQYRCKKSHLNKCKEGYRFASGMEDGEPVFYCVKVDKET